jgi:hypothetical protein
MQRRGRVGRRARRRTARTAPAASVTTRRCGGPVGHGREQVLRFGVLFVGDRNAHGGFANQGLSQNE